MDFSKVKTAARTIGEVVHRNSPTILSGMAIVGTVSSTVMAIQVTPRAHDILESIEDANGEVTWRDYLTIVKDFYIPTIASEAATIACIVASTRISNKRTAAIAAAHSILEATLANYQEQIIEDFGENAARKLTEKVDQRSIKENPVIEDNIIQTTRGDSLCYDPLSGRYFRSDISELKSAQNDLNYRLLNDLFVPLNDLYDILELPELHEVVGDELGWSVYRGQVDFRFTTDLASNGEPCIILGFDIWPEHDYRRIWK